MTFMFGILKVIKIYILTFAFFCHTNITFNDMVLWIVQYKLHDPETVKQQMFSPL